MPVIARATRIKKQALARRKLVTLMQAKTGRIVQVRVLLQVVLPTVVLPEAAQPVIVPPEGVPLTIVLPEAIRQTRVPRSAARRMRVLLARRVRRRGRPKIAPVNHTPPMALRALLVQLRNILHSPKATRPMLSLRKSVWEHFPCLLSCWLCWWLPSWRRCLRSPVAPLSKTVKLLRNLASQQG